MAHVRRGQLAAPREWARHLRPEGKRAQAQIERIAARKQLRALLQEHERDQEPYARYDSPMRDLEH